MVQRNTSKNVSIGRRFTAVLIVQHAEVGLILHFRLLIALATRKIYTVYFILFDVRLATKTLIWKQNTIDSQPFRRVFNRSPSSSARLFVPALLLVSSLAWPCHLSKRVVAAIMLKHELHNVLSNTVLYATMRLSSRRVNHDGEHSCTNPFFWRNLHQRNLNGLEPFSTNTLLASYKAKRKWIFLRFLLTWMGTLLNITHLVRHYTTTKLSIL